MLVPAWLEWYRLTALSASDLSSGTCHARTARTFPRCHNFTGSLQHLACALSAAVVSFQALAHPPPWPAEHAMVAAACNACARMQKYPIQYLILNCQADWRRED
jgi:hypothetical protein